MPFPLVGADFTVLVGVAGNTASIVVTNSSGKTTASQRLTYIPATVSYPLAGVSLYDGIYDPPEIFTTSPTPRRSRSSRAPRVGGSRPSQYLNRPTLTAPRDYTRLRSHQTTAN